MKYYFKIKQFLLKIIRLNGTPLGIALGFAIGLFLSIIPTFAVGMFIALGLCPVFKTSPVSTYLGTLIVNPFSGIFIYSLNFFIGSLIFKTDKLFFLPKNLNDIMLIGKQLYTGGLIVSLTMSALSFLIIYYGIKIYRNKKIAAQK